MFMATMFALVALVLLAAFGVRWLCAKTEDTEVQNAATEMATKPATETQPKAQNEPKPQKQATKAWIRLAVYGKDSHNRKTRRRIRAGGRK